MSQDKKENKLIVTIDYKGAVGWVSPDSKKMLLIGFGFITQDTKPENFKEVHKGDAVSVSIRAWSPSDNRNLVIFYGTIESMG